MKKGSDIPSVRAAAIAFQELADAAPAMLWETAPDGQCTFISRGWTDLSGQSNADALGLGWLDAIHPEDRDRTRETFLKANTDRVPFQVEYRIQDAKGGYRWATAAARPRFDSSGAFTGYAGSTVDVDALKRAERDLLESETRMRLAADVAQFGTFEWNIQTNVNVWSTELEKIYGLEPGTFEGTYEAWRDLVHPDDLKTAERGLEEALETEGFGGEWRIIRPDGAVRWIEARTRIFHDADGQPLKMIGINLDITDRKRAEEELRDAAHRKDQFLAVLAHELRNPLAPIRNAAAILGRVGSEDIEVFEKATGMIERQVTHLARLTDDLLDVSRIGLGKVRIDKEPVELGRIIREAVDDYRPFLESASGLTLEVRLPDAPVWIDGDEVRLAQAVGNLLHNAGKFTDSGGTVAVELAVEGQEALVTVRDSGIGLSETLLDRLFEPFSQDDHVVRNPGGLGLGLALVRGFVELHGGSVTGSSEGPHEGSEFTIRLPAVETPPSRAEVRPTAEESTTASVVLVEDSADVAESLSLYLELHGHTVHVATDGSSGVDLARRVVPDFVLCDLGLPGEMDGLDVARALRDVPELEETKLIALTGYGQERDRTRTAEAGFEMHLLKPVDLNHLMSIIDGEHGESGGDRGPG